MRQADFYRDGTAASLVTLSCIVEMSEARATLLNTNPMTGEVATPEFFVTESKSSSISVVDPAHEIISAVTAYLAADSGGAMENYFSKD